MSGYGKRVLLVDDIEATRRSLATALEEEQFVVVRAQDGAQALYEMQHRHFDAVITEDHVPQLNGLDLLKQCRLAWPETPVIVFSGLDWDRSRLAAAQGAFAWIRKSSDPGILLSMLALAMEQDVEPEARERVEA